MLNKSVCTIMTKRKCEVDFSSIQMKVVANPKQINDTPHLYIAIDWCGYTNSIYTRNVRYSLPLFR